MLVWDVVRYVRRDLRDLYREFLHERTIYDHVVGRCPTPASAA